MLFSAILHLPLQLVCQNLCEHGIDWCHLQIVLGLHQISWISIKLFAEHIVKMLLKHCKKFTAAAITELVKITKQEIGALPTSSNGMSVLLIDSLDSTVLLFICSKHILSGNLSNTEYCYDIICD